MDEDDMSGLGDEPSFESTDSDVTLSYEDPTTSESVIPPDQPGGPDLLDEVTDSTSETQSVIPADQPGGPGYEEPSPEELGYPILFDAPADPITWIGPGWGTVEPVSECCVPLPGFVAEGDEPIGVTFEAEGPTDLLPGFDSNDDGVSDFVLVDATQTGQVDTWLLDQTGSGVVDTMYLDTEGFGLPTASCTDLEATGTWTEPRQLPPADQSVIPWGQPGGPGYEPGAGVDLREVYQCTTDPGTQQAVLTIANDLTPAPAPLLDPATDTETPPPTFDQDLSKWSQQGLPEEWEVWTEPEATETYTDESYSPDWGQVTPEWSENGESPFPVSEPEVPVAEVVSNVVGPGHESDVYWAYQGETNYCVLYSVRAILSELYGYDVDINEMEQRALANRWFVYDEKGDVLGIMNDRIDEVLASYGVPSHEWSQGEQGAWEALNTALTNNQRIVLSLDSKEIDAQRDVGDFAGVLDSDHVVSVEGIDYGKGVVIVNDSARSAGLEIPINVFYNTWRDSNFNMTITDIAAPAGAGAVPPAGAGEFAADAPEMVLLGITIHLWHEVEPDELEAAEGAGAMSATVIPDGQGVGLEAARATSRDWPEAVVACCTPAGWDDDQAIPTDFSPPGADAYRPLSTDAEPLTWFHPNGTGNSLAWGLDASGDGKIDVVPLSIRREGGIPDAWLLDLIGNGVANMLLLDVDQDGIPDAEAFDRLGNGSWSDPEPIRRAVAGDASTFSVGGDPTGLFTSHASEGVPGTITIGGPTDIGLGFGEQIPGDQPNTISIGGPRIDFPEAIPGDQPNTISIGGPGIEVPEGIPPDQQSTISIGGPETEIPATPNLNEMLDGLARLGNQTNDPAISQQLRTLVESIADSPTLRDWARGIN